MAEVYMAGDLRNNTTFELDGNVFKVVEFQHVKPGKGAAFVRMKLKNLRTGTNRNLTIYLSLKGTLL